MNRRGSGEMHGGVAVVDHAQAQIEVLVVDEEPLVETAAAVEQLATDHQERAHDLVDRARVEMVPFGHEMRQHGIRHNPVEK